MSNRNTHLTLLLTYLLLCFVANCQVYAAGNDLLTLKAISSPLAKSSLLLDITRAGDRLVVVGERGHILFSDDSGKSWTQAEVPVMVTLTAVDFPTSKEGWAVGHDGVVLKSTDGGEHWTVAFTGEDANRLRLANAEQNLQEKISTQESLHETGQFTNSQEIDDLTWAAESAKMALEEGPWKPFMDVEFSNENVGFIIGSYGMIFKTEDGGENWQAWDDHVPNPYALHLNSFGRTKSGLIMVGEEGTLYRSLDDGESWDLIPSPYQGSFFSVVTQENSDTVIILGLRGHGYSSYDMGNSWQKLNIHVNTSLNGGYLDADGSAFILSSNLFYGPGLNEPFTSMSLPLSAYSSMVKIDDDYVAVVGMNGVERIRIGN